MARQRRSLTGRVHSSWSLLTQVSHWNLSGYIVINSPVTWVKKSLLWPGLSLLVCKQDTSVRTKSVKRAAGLSYFRGPPKAKTERGWLKGKFTNAAKLNEKEYDVKSQSTEQDDLQPLQLCLWALAAICYSLYFICPFLLCSPAGRAPVLFGYWDCA